MMKRFRARETCLLFILILGGFLISGCGGGGKTGHWLPRPIDNTTAPIDNTTAPTVISTAPDNAATVCKPTTIEATFSLAMDNTTIDNTTFTVTDNVGTPVLGDVTYSDNTAVFTPTDNLAADATYTATISIEVKSTDNTALASEYSWSFTTGATTCVAPIDLGAAASFGIASTAGVTNTITAPNTTINGDAVLDPNITCNAVDMTADGTFGLCNGMAPTITGTVISPLYPDAGVTSGAVKDALRQTYIDISPAQLPGATPIAAGTTLGEPSGSALVEGDNLFYPGVYQSITTIMITGDLTLDALGDPNAVFVFQSSGTIGTAASTPPADPTRILLAGSAKASNVWWQAGGAATLGTYTEFQGNILAYSDITMETGATSCGRLFAGASTDGAFVFDSNVVSVPGHPDAPAGCE